MNELTPASVELPPLPKPMIWGAPLAEGKDLHIARAIVRAMELLNDGERPLDPARGGRLLDVPEEML